MRKRAADDDAKTSDDTEHIARALLKRYGVVFRKLVERESQLPPWRELFYVLRRLEARGEIRGGRFVSGFSGEQFALPEAAASLRRFREEKADDLRSEEHTSELQSLIRSTYAVFCLTQKN